MLISWAILIALAGLTWLMIDRGMEMLPVFGILAAVLAALCVGAHVLLKKQAERYYCAG